MAAAHRFLERDYTPDVPGAAGADPARLGLDGRDSLIGMAQ